MALISTTLEEIYLKEMKEKWQGMGLTLIFHYFTFPFCFCVDINIMQILDVDHFWVYMQWQE